MCEERSADEPLRHRGWEQSRAHQFVPKREAVRVIQAKQSHCDGANFREADDAPGIKGEVFRPEVYARIEKAHQILIRASCDVAALCAIAEWAAKGEVVFLGRAVVLFADDMIHMKGVNPIALVQQAIFTELRSAAPHPFPEGWRDACPAHAAPWASLVRARALARLRTRSTSITRSNSSRSPGSSPSDFSLRTSHSKRSLAAGDGRNATSSCGVTPHARNSITSS